jgi:SRSO17 transposase
LWTAFLLDVGRPPGEHPVFVWNNSDAAVAASRSVDPDRWWSAYGEVIDRIAPRFTRYEPLRHAGALMLGLLSGLDRKNCWTIAEHRGDTSPDGLQHLLARAKWDADAVRDDLRGYVVDHFADPDAVLVVDETGDVKKGTQTVGVQRQYTGTAGRIENSQVAVFLTYAARHGHAFIDRALYLPKSWTEDAERLVGAGVPAGTGFATKPALATTMITNAVAAGVPAAWVAGDEVYCADTKLRAAVRAAGLGYVLQVAANRRVPTTAGAIRVDELAAMLPDQAWQKASAGTGSKGERFYSWAWITIQPEPDPEPALDADENSGAHHVLIRRNDTTDELAFHRCYAPHPVSLAQLVRVAGQRWRIEESFQAAKGLTGLDQHQVRRWTSWHRWTTLAMLAHAFLAVTTAAEREQTPAPAGLIALTVNEFRRLFDALLLGTKHTIDTLLAWSQWRRRHQHRAREAHYRSREHQ